MTSSSGLLTMRIACATIMLSAMALGCTNGKQASHDVGVAPESEAHQYLFETDAKGQLKVSNKSGKIRPVGYLADLDDDDFSEDSTFVGDITVDANYDPLGLVAGESDSLYLGQADDGTWNGTIVGANNRTKHLAVTHYVYAGASAKDYPPTARWDTLQSAEVIGIRCGKGWCMVGVNAPQPNDVDPEDNPANNMPARVRGWADWKPATPGNRLTVIPVDGLGKHRKKQYRNGYVHVASIYSSTSPADSAYVSLFLTGKDNWHAEYKNARGSFLRDLVTGEVTVHHNLLVPGVARWDASPVAIHTVRGANGRSALDVGDLWIRCASGCCEADAYIPI